MLRPKLRDARHPHLRKNLTPLRNRSCAHAINASAFRKKAAGSAAKTPDTQNF
jgi:hypothetical protein